MVLAALLWASLGCVIWPTEPFKIEVRTTLWHSFVFLSPERQLVPTNLAVYMQVTNNGDSVNRIDSYGVKILIPSLSDSGAILEKWYPLKAVKGLDSSIYSVSEKEGLSKARRLDFNEVDFIETAKTHIDPKDKISGWLFFEIASAVDGSINPATAIEITLSDVTGHVQTYKHNFRNAEKHKGTKDYLDSIALKYPHFKLLGFTDLSGYKGTQPTN